jgi:hypothetical protein
MKKFVKKIFFFLSFFCVLFILYNTLFLGILMLTDWDFKKRLESLNFVNPDFELLVLGSSLPEYGIDTEFLTEHLMKSYNLALHGNPLKTSYVQLNEYLVRYSKKPKYVILGLNSFLDEQTEYIHPVVDLTMKSHKFVLNDIPIISLRWFGVEFLKKILSSGHRKTKMSFGQVKSPRVNSDKTDYDILNLDLKEFELSYWIGEIAKLCTQNGIELIIIEMPGVKEKQNLTEIGPRTINFVNGYSALLYNLNNQEFCSFINENKDWVGLSHLNETGALKFTIELLKILQ